jgi:hypothetical protein
MGGALGQERWRRVPALSLAVVVIAVALVTASIWNNLELVRRSGLDAADQFRIVVFSLPSAPCLVAIVGLLLLRTTQLINPQPATAVSTAALIVGRVVAAVYVIGSVAGATDAITTTSKTGFPTAFRGPSVLTESSLAVLGAAAWLVASSDALPSHRRPTPNRVEIEVATDG